MQIEVGTYIAELLFTHHAVTIPGLGGFTSQYKDAQIDQIQGIIKPPSKKISFNKNLAVNDGLLVNFIAEKHKVTTQEAKKAVEDYVQQVLNAFGRKEMVIIPKVGRLYRDYKGQYEFLPENTNFNTDAYGLPHIQFKPIARSKEDIQHTPAAAVKNPKAKNKENEVGEQLGAWLQKNFPLIISVAVIVIALIIFLLIYDKPSKEEQQRSINDIPENLVNRKPSVDDTTTAFENEAADNILMEDDEEANAAVEEPSQLPGQRSCVIAIGLFGDQNNVQRLVERIYDEGFEPYIEQRGQYTRVGIQFAYETQREIDEKLTIIRDKFEEDAVIIKK